MEKRQLVSVEPFEKRVSKDICSKVEDAIWKSLFELDNPEDFFEPFEYPFENLKQIADSDNEEYKESIRQMADDIWDKGLWLSALIVYYILLHITHFLPTDFYKFGYVLGKFGLEDEAIEIVSLYEALASNKKVMYHALANFYYCALNIPTKSIEYYEECIKLDSKNASAYSSIGHLYSNVNTADVLAKQLEYFQKAYELEPDNANYLKNVLTVYEKLHNVEKIKELYPKLIELSPTPIHSLNYGLYEFSWGNIQKSYPYIVERFDIPEYPIGYPKEVLNLTNKWNYNDDISDKIFLIHYEEGFGDSIMFGRFLPLIKQFGRETVVVLQTPLKELFLNSATISEGVAIFDNIHSALKYIGNREFVHIPFMDMPYPLGVDKCFIPFSDKYLTSSSPMGFDKNKLNIGIAYSGDLSANYNGRDVDLKEFYRIASIEGVQLYSLQVGAASEQLKTVPQDINIVDLGKTFTDFMDTANAISGLDLVISTDNVILNLAGALGVKTFGVFNKYPNYRWFDLSKDDVVWYKSVKPLQCKIENGWHELFCEIEEEVRGLV